MSVRTVHKRIIISLIVLVGSMGVTVGGLYLFRVPEQPQTVNISTPPIAKTNVQTETAEHVYSLPSRLVIPKLAVDASILPMGQTNSGAMESPTTNTDTGWYSLGARPGNKGSAVIAGHLGLRKEAVFGNLDLLVKGDTFSVIDDQGETATFVVRETRSYKRDSDSTEIFNSTQGTHLNLITCNGDWESAHDTYEERLVVFSDKM